MVVIVLWLFVILVLLAASVGFALAAFRTKEPEVRDVGEPAPAEFRAPATLEARLADGIIARERATWEATKTKDKSMLTSLLADDYKEVSETGVKGKSEALQTLDDGVITGYWFDDVRVMEQDRHVAVITYKVRIEGVYKGQAFPPKFYYTTSIWMNRNGNWQAVLSWAPN